MNRVTIDKLDIRSHERYAKDQHTLDRKYINESTAIASHSEILGTSTIYSSSWEQLFELNMKNLPWACFSPPLKYTIQANRFFSYQILPSIYIRDERDEEEEESEENDEEKKQNEKKRLEIINKISKAAKGEHQTYSDFENEKSAIISLVESIRYLDKILGQINSKKRQYQKG